MNKVTPKLNNRHVAMIAILLVAIFVAGGIWWWIYASQTVSTDDARVKGTIVAVSAKASGRIEKVLVNEGDNVEAGQVIAVIEKEELAAQVNQAKASLAVAEANLAATIAGKRHQEIAQANAGVLEAKASMENARKNSERDEALFKDGVISAHQNDASSTAYDIAKAKYASAAEALSLSAEGSRQEDIQMAQAQVQKAKAALELVELQLADAFVKAPVSGVVAIKSAEVGEVIAAGQQLFSITNPADVWIGANIEETYIGRVKIGQQVKFTVDAYPGTTFTGQVSEVGPATGSQFALLATENSSANFTKVTQRLPIKIKPEESELVLKPGMSAIIKISTR
ncbi:MAG: emrA 1 [Firmicutes bacterium]|nr:emrA 1 [Bacillota bacterium]